MEKTNERTSVTVSIRDVFLYLCSRWRVLIIWLVIGAVLGGAYSGYKSLRSGSKADISSRATAIYEKMSDTDKTNVQNNVTTFIHYMNQFDFYSAYDAKSLFQKLNPDTARVGIFTYDIEGADDNAVVENVVRTFAANITDDSFAQDVAKAFNISAEEAFYYYDGIVRVGDSMITVTTTDKTVTDIKGEISAPLIIRVYGENDEFVKKMMELVRNSAERISNALSKTTGRRITLVNETTKKNDDTYIYDRQEEYVTNIKQVISNSNSLKDALDDDMLTAVKHFITEQYDGKYIDFVFPGSSAENKAGTLHISKKWIAAGGAGLLILAILAIIIKYLIKGVIRCYDDIEYTYGIQVLGTYDDPKTVAKDHKSRLDKWLKSLRIKRKSQDRDSSAALIAKKIQLLAKNHDIKNICIAIGPDVSVDESFLEDVAGRTGDIQVSVADNILRNADAISKMIEAEGVILLEQMDKSRFSAIDEERVMCAGNNIKILGVIVAE